MKCEELFNITTIAVVVLLVVVEVFCNLGPQILPTMLWESITTFAKYFHSMPRKEVKVVTVVNVEEN
jgi:hypothetical protein